MTTTEALTIGYIPKNWKGERISCGGSDTGTSEISIDIIGRGDDGDVEVSCSETGDKFSPNSNSDWWGDNSKMWRQIAKIVNPLSKGKAVILGAQLAACWRVFKQETEGEDDLGITVVAQGEDYCGEFTNPDGMYNGFFYVRYMIENDGEYDDEEETVIVVEPRAGP